jgi:GTP-binding protein
VIAHVDHGKTTLLDAMLRQAGAFQPHQRVQDRALDNMDQERERGITILAKTTTLVWEGICINVVDTPGHADFGGEVERVLRMVDSALVLVDACEGPMPQTRFVLQKALALGLRPILVVNKIDRPQAQLQEVVSQVFDLMDALGASDEQLDFPVVFASARAGIAGLEPDEIAEDLRPLFDTVIEHAPPPEVDPDGPYQAQVAILDYDDYIGRIGIGRVYRGAIRRGDRAVVIREGGQPRPFRVTSLMGFCGLERVDIEEARAGDVIALAGAPDITVGDTICAVEAPEPLPAIEVDPPTISMVFQPNDSPFSGREGRFVTSRHIHHRLMREREHNVSLRIENTESPDRFLVSGRGVLHLGVFIETLRREGYELQVGAPEVIVLEDPETGEATEPHELVEVQVPSAMSGTVVEGLAVRGGRMDDMRRLPDGTARLRFIVSSRGLIGYRTQFQTDTRGEGVMASVFSHYAPLGADLARRKNGALIALEPCDSVAYGLFGLQDRGVLFYGPGVSVYGGMVIGLHAKDNDLVVNPGKMKKLTNMRASGSDEAIRLTPPQPPGLEQALELIGPDELVELTPMSVRLRKRILDHTVRKRDERVRANPKP